MLKKTRQDVENEVYNAINHVCKPSEAIGWPPQLEEYIRAMIQDVATSILWNIYSREELDEEANKILLEEELKTQTDSIIT